MEEKKIASKEIKMEPVEKPKEQQRLTYEELNQACAELSQQLQNQNAYIQKMRQQLQQLDMLLQTKRIDYLFKVVELQDNFKSDFVVACCDEIQESLTIPQEDEKKEG